MQEADVEESKKKRRRKKNEVIRGDQWDFEKKKKEGKRGPGGGWIHMNV